ncbi:hypothetical protein SteCoe_16220 [Stentor coeruleus]|uniref:Kinesin motor domain-containing protein n=1 Tax=Stentor coeruleus TaxID=5963 RepID=A0A1R2C1T6_9CILI|nr:hypothetical protein SteCoe_16220 [Stentor coeruleus]
MSDFKDNVRVALRIRPLNAKESNENATKCVSIVESKTILLDTKPEAKSFTYDFVAGEDISQDSIFEMVGKPITTSCIKGYNGTIFAYGQTGAGKTFTIQGAGYEEYSSSSKCNYHLRGILPRCFEYLFSSIADEVSKNNAQYLIKCSYLEIYQENINDLLDQNPRSLQLREDMKKGVYVEGLIEETVRNAMETYNLLNIGAQNRHVSSTSMNKESSRSHSVFTMIIESKSSIDGLVNFKTSRFHLIDLAGSERQKATDCAGERLKEAGMINKSLSALGNVINSLVDISEGKSRHVHYRDSKLTFLLKDSLGGNSKTFIIANISPAVSAFAETLSTLKFAQRAKMIKNTAVVNEDVSGTVNLLKYEIKKLKDELQNQKTNTEFTGTCPKCSLLSNRSIELYDLLDNTKELEFLIEKNTKIRVNSEKQLETVINDKEKQIKALKSALAKVESKANNDKMVLKFRDATIAKLQVGVECDETENLKKENLLLREQLENNPVAAQLFVENEKLKAQCENLKKECKWEAESCYGRLRDGQDYAERLSVLVKNSAIEKEKIMQMVDGMIKENDKLKSLLGKNESEIETKVKILENEKEALITRVRGLLKRSKSSSSLEEEENLLKSAERIEEFFRTSLSPTKSPDRSPEKLELPSQGEVEELQKQIEELNEKVMNSNNKIKKLEEELTQKNEENTFLKDKSESKDNTLNQALQEVENLTDSCEYLKSTIEKLQAEIKDKNDLLIVSENTTKRLETQISELLSSLNSADNTQECENLTKKIEELEKTKEKLSKKHANLAKNFSELENLYKIAKEQEAVEKENVRELYTKLGNTMEELEEFKDREQGIYEKIEIAEEEKLKIIEKMQRTEEKYKKFKQVSKELEKEKAQVEERVEVIKKEFDEKMMKNTQEIKDKENELKELIKVERGKSEENMKLNKENAQIKEKICELKEENDLKTKENNDKTKINENLFKELADTKEKHNKTLEENTKLNIKVENLEKEAIEKAQKVAEILEKANKLKDQYAETYTKLSQVSENNSQLEAKIQKYEEKEHEKNEILEKLGKVSIAASEAGVSLSTLTEFSDNYQKLAEKNAKLERRLKRSEKSLKKNEDKIAEISLELGKKTEIVGKLEKNLGEIKDNEKKLEEENLELKELFENSERVCKDLKNEIALLEEQIQNGKTKHKNVNAANEKIIQDLQNEKKGLQSMIFSNSAIIQSLHEKILEEENKIKQLTAYKSESYSIISEKQKNINTLQAKLQEEIDAKDELLISKNSLENTLKTNEDYIKDLNNSLENERQSNEENILKRLEAEKFSKIQEDQIQDLKSKLENEGKKHADLLKKIKEVEEIAEKSQAGYKEMWGQVRKTDELKERVMELEEIIRKMKTNYHNILKNLEIINNQEPQEDTEDIDEVVSKIENCIKTYSISNAQSSEAKDQLYEISSMFSINTNEPGSFVNTLSFVKKELEETSKQLSATQDLLQMEKKRTEILTKESEIIRGKLIKVQQEHAKELKVLQETISKQDQNSYLSADMNAKLNLLEASTQELNQKLDQYKNSCTDLTIENNGFKDKINELNRSKDKVDKELSIAKEEIEALKEENKSKMEILKNTNKNILSTRNEINMWKKCLDDKNTLIQDLRNELKNKDDEMSKLLIETKHKNKSSKDPENDEQAEVKYLNQVLQMKEKELKDLKEKGQEYYFQADEALESQRKEIEIFTKRCTSLQGEVKRLKEELKLSMKEREVILDEMKKLKNDEYKTYRDNEDAKKMLNQLREEKTKLLLELSKENEQGYGTRNRAQERMRQENLLMRTQIDKLNQELQIAQRQSESFINRYRESGEGNLRVEIDKQAEEIQNLNESLSKITAFVFSLPQVNISPDETSIVESTIKAIKSLSEQSVQKDIQNKFSKVPEEKQSSNPQFKSQLAQYYALVNKAPKSPGNYRYKSAFK